MFHAGLARHEEMSVKGELSFMMSILCDVRFLNIPAFVGGLITSILFLSKHRVLIYSVKSYVKNVSSRSHSVNCHIVRFSSINVSRAHCLVSCVDISCKTTCW